MIVGSIMMIFPWYEKSTNSIMNSYAVEYEVFLSELRTELNSAVDVGTRNKNVLEIKADNLTAEEGKFEIEYIMSSGRVVKRYGKIGGIDIKLTRIKNVEYTVEKEKITMTTNFNNHTEKVRDIVFPKK